MKLSSYYTGLRWNWADIFDGVSLPVFPILQALPCTYIRICNEWLYLRPVATAAAPLSPMFILRLQWASQGRLDFKPLYTFIHYMVTCTVHGPVPYSSDQPQLPQSLHHWVDCESLSQCHYPFKSNLTPVKSAVGNAHKHTLKHTSHYERNVLQW